MSIFTLAISCLTTSNLLWFMDLTFQVPMQYFSLQHWTLLSPPDTSTARHSFCFHSAFSFLWEPFLPSSPVVYWTPSKGFIFQCHVFLPFHTVHGVFKGRMLKWFAFPFSRGPPLSELSANVCLSWGALHDLSHSFIELDQVVVPVISLVSFLWLWFSFCLPSDG